MRKRKVAVNPAPCGKHMCKSMNKSTAAVSIKPQKRVTEFPGEHLTVSNGKLFCVACREELNLKKSSVKNQSSKRKYSKSKLKAKEQDIRIQQALQRHNDECHLHVETLPLEQQVFRVKVVRLFLRAAVALNKLDCFRDLLEEHAWRLTDGCHISHLVAFLLKEASYSAIWWWSRWEVYQQLMVQFGDLEPFFQRSLGPVHI